MRIVIFVEAGASWARYREELLRAGVPLPCQCEIVLADFDDVVPPELREHEEYLRAMSFREPGRLHDHERSLRSESTTRGRSEPARRGHAKTDLLDGHVA